MKTAILTLSAAGLLAAFTLHAQMPPPKPDVSAALEKIKATNAALLQQQETTLKELAKMKETARELKIYSKRG